MKRSSLAFILLMMFFLQGFVLAEPVPNISCEKKKGYPRSEATLTEIEKNRYLEKRRMFLNFVDECSEKLLSINSIIVPGSFFKEWEEHFRDTQLSWLKQLEKDSKNLVYSKESLGGSHHDRTSFVYSANKIDERINEIKSQLSCLFGK